MKTVKKILLAVGGIVAVLTFLVVLEASIPEAVPVLTQSTKPIEAQVVTPEKVETALNEWRVDHGLPTFKTDNPALDEAAQVRAETMCAANDWSHDKAWQVLDQYYSYTFASENLHFSHLRVDQADAAIYGWEHSPGHLKTMQADHKEASIGVKYCPGYQGLSTAVLIVNYFGNPR